MITAKELLFSFFFLAVPIAYIMFRVYDDFRRDKEERRRERKIANRRRRIIIRRFRQIGEKLDDIKWFIEWDWIACDAQRVVKELTTLSNETNELRMIGMKKDK